MIRGFFLALFAALLLFIQPAFAGHIDVDKAKLELNSEPYDEIDWCCFEGFPDEEIGEPPITLWYHFIDTKYNCEYCAAVWNSFPEDLGLTYEEMKRERRICTLRGDRH